jgi:SET domain-containing protein
MELVITPPKKICVKNSPVHGLGIFATEKIIAGELIEECPILSLPMKFGETSSLFIDYRFNWPSGSSQWEEQVVALGFASLYNHSESPNAYWFSVSEKRTFQFVASRDIEVDEEVFVWYGDSNYWNDGRSTINVIN